jgi:dihydropteroate synthase
MIDVGGESTRPGATPVSVQEELDRVLPVVERLARELPVPISVDTSKPEVMREAARAGAGLINDVRALRLPGALEAAVASGVPVCLMHHAGEPGRCNRNPVMLMWWPRFMPFWLSGFEPAKSAGIPARPDFGGSRFRFRQDAWRTICTAAAS